MRQEGDTNGGPNTDSGKQGPQSPRQREKTAADRYLPDIRDKRRHHQDRGCLRRRHEKPQQTNRYGRDR
jgi:hypothetical protein